MMIVLGERNLHNQGYLMGSEVIHIPQIGSYFLTIVAVIGDFIWSMV